MQQKERLKARVDRHRAPLTRYGLHNRLVVALNDSIRYLHALGARYQAGRPLFLRMFQQGVIMDADTVQTIEERARLSVDPIELDMGRAYEREYGHVREQLGLEPVNVKL